MINMLLTSRYVFDQELRISAKPGFAGINYTDGNETEQHYILRMVGEHG